MRSEANLFSDGEFKYVIDIVIQACTLKPYCYPPPP